MTTRPSWTRYFMEIAHAVATRATCPRKSVGCVIVSRDNHILTTGYNGSPPGMPHCTEAGCDMLDGHCVRASHAETNAVAQAARHGISIEGATVYVTAYPCWNCFRQLLVAGVSSVVYDEAYRNDERVEGAARLRGVRIMRARSVRADQGSAVTRTSAPSGFNAGKGLVLRQNFNQEGHLRR